MLYDMVKKTIFEKIKKHSAYRSGLLVQEYKRQFEICSRRASSICQESM